MDINTLEKVREAVHASSLALLLTVILIAAIGLLKPGLLRGIFKEFAERKYILAMAVFVCLLFGTVFTATQDTTRSYDYNRQAVSNSAGSLEQPNRQVYGSSANQKPDEPENTNSNTENGETLGASQSNKPQSEEPKQQSKAVQPAASNSSSAQQPPASNPPAQPQDECFKILVVCL